MPNLTYTVLKDEYNQLFDTCTIDPNRVDDINSTLARFQQNSDRYSEVQVATGVPWYVIAVIHKMEADCDFDCHLHNGDPLTARTYHVPAGRPISGNPIFSWEFSAEDALGLDGLTTWDWADTGISGVCYNLEKYNGFGYRWKHINSPYLWSGTNHYQRGKYTSDGIFDPNAASQQIGALAYLKMMAANNVISFDITKGGKATATVLNDTFLKQSPVQSSQLQGIQKVSIKSGTNLPLLAYLVQGDHFKITLDNLTYNNKNIWYIYANHVKIAPTR